MPGRLVLIHESELGLYSASKQTVDRLGSFSQYEFDVGHFRDPIGQPKFFDRPTLDGTHPGVIEWIVQDRKYQPLLDEVRLLAMDHIRVQKSEWLSIMFYDHHGIWISPALVEAISEEMVNEGYRVGIQHYDLPRT